MASKRAHSTSPPTVTKKRSTGSGFVLTSTPSGHPGGHYPAKVTRVVQGKSRQIDLKNGPPLVEYPPLNTIWTVFGDNASTQFLTSSPGLLDYERNVKHFHGRLALVVRGLNLGEISALYRATLPAWTAHEKEEVLEEMCNKFESAYDWAQECIISKIKAYADLWFKSESGSAYKKAWDFAELKKRATRYPFPADPTHPADMLHFNGKEGLNFSRANVIDFFMVGLAAVETKDSKDDCFVGWIKDDEDDTWYNALRTVALSLILKFCMMQMNTPKGEVYELAVQMMMRSVVTFDVSEGFTHDLKLRLVCKKANTPLNLDGLMPSMFSADRPNKVPTVPSPDPLISNSPSIIPGVRAVSTFEKALLSAAPSSFTPLEGPTDEDFRKDHVTQLMALNKRLDIQPSVHRIDTLSPPIYAADKAEAIGKMYALLPLEAADEWHRKRMVHEAARLQLITAQAANRHALIESRIAAIDRRKVQRAKQQDTIRQIKAANAQRQLELEKAEKELQRQIENEEAENARTTDPPPFQTNPGKDLRGSTAPLGKLVTRTGGLLGVSVDSNSIESATTSPEEEEAAAYMQEMIK